MVISLLVKVAGCSVVVVVDRVVLRDDVLVVGGLVVEA